MARDSDKKPRRGTSPDVEDDELLTDPGLDVGEGLVLVSPQITEIPTGPHNPVDLSESAPEDPTVAGGLRLDSGPHPTISVSDEEARLAEEGLVPVDPASYGADPEEDTAALQLPPDFPPAPQAQVTERPEPATEAAPPVARDETRAASPAEWVRPPAPREAIDSRVGTRSDRAPSEVPGFVDEETGRDSEPPPPTVPPPAAVPYADEATPASLPGAPVQDAPVPFVVDEDTYGPQEALPPGSKLAFDIYQVERLLGEGRDTRTYLATDLRDDRAIALAEFKDPGAALTYPSVRNLLERFRQGSPAPAVLDHDGAIQLEDFIDDPVRGPLVVMEFVPAGDLESFLAHRGRPLSPREAATVFMRICDTLRHALSHGVVHGNIQPRNILLTADAQPKIDLVTPVLFGGPIARPDADFAAPEVRQGQEPGPAADVYGLGASLYQAVTDPSVTARGGEAPAEIEPIIARCVADDPRERYATVDDLAADLETLLHAPPPRSGPPLAQIGLGAIAIAIGLGVGVWLTAGGDDPGTPLPAETAPAAATVSDTLMADAVALREAGQILEAAAAFKRIVDANPGLTDARTAYTEIRADKAYRSALKALRRRLRKANDATPRADLRRDLDLLGVLAPRDALIDHWRSRLNQSNDKNAPGSSAP